MEKTMARLDGGYVINMESHSAYTQETDTLKDIGDRPVGIGDTYDNGRWYRDGVEILSPLEAKLAELEAENADLKNAFEIMGGTV